MKFTYDEYKNLINYIKLNNYAICDYFDYERFDKPCILRHDVDNSLEKALEFAILENKLGVKSTYFILLTSDFYNIYSKKSLEIINKMISLGHTIGLHFDELSYDLNSDVVSDIKKEINIMSDILNYEVKVVSMHRPSNKTLESSYNIDGIINSYSSEFFKEFKYISDSRRNWRENPYEVIGNYDKLHILTHAFWYNSDDIDISNSIRNFINSGCIDRYNILKQNISNIDDIISKNEVLYEDKRNN